MTEALQELMEQVQRLDPAAQEEIVLLVRRKLARLERETRRQSAIARQNAEWAARLDEQLARAARGENPIYHSEKELFDALDAIPYKEQE